MGNIISVALGTEKLGNVVRAAAIDVACLAAVLAGAVLLARLLQALAVRAIALVAGATSANVIVGYLTYPGVLFHELSHALAALLSGARVTGISLGRVAAADGSGWVLGSVTFVPRGPKLLQAFQLALTGIAPALTGLAGLAALVHFGPALCSKPWHGALLVYLFICVLLHMDLSQADVARILEGLPLVALTAFVVFLFIPQEPERLIAWMQGLFHASS